MMKKILLVCMGNICRSPMAEGIVKQAFRERGIHAEVDSCGTGAWHAGEAPDPRAQREVARHGIDISGLRARQFSTEDFDRFDHIYTMDRSNLSDLYYLSAKEEHRAKLSLFMNIAEPGSDKDVPDPYYGGDEGFKKVYHMLRQAAEALAGKIENKQI